MFLSNVMTNRSGWFAYRHVHTEQVSNASQANSGGALIADTTSTCEQALMSRNEPAIYQGKMAMHYVETMNTTAGGWGFPCTDYVWDVYYDKDTNLIRGGVGYDDGGAGDRWNIPAGTPLTGVSGFYGYDNKGSLEPNMLMGSSYYLTGTEKMTFDGNETVMVPAGTFSGASHFTEQQENCYYTPCTTTTWQYWAVPGIPGFVKIQYDIDGPHEIYPLIHTHLREDTELTGRG